MPRIEALIRQPLAEGAGEGRVAAARMSARPTALSVNVNKVALLRNTRHLGIPSVVKAATLALQAGADGITVHPRPDERHIRAHDVHDLAAGDSVSFAADAPHVYENPGASEARYHDVIVYAR